MYKIKVQITPYNTKGPREKYYNAVHLSKSIDGRLVQFHYCVGNSFSEILKEVKEVWTKMHDGTKVFDIKKSGLVSSRFKFN